MQFRNPLSLAFSVTLALTFFLGVLLWYPHLSAAAGETAVVAGDVVNIRNGPGTGYGIVSAAGLGDRLSVLDKSGDWYQVALTTGGKGWIAGWLVNVDQQQTPASAPGSGQVAAVNGNSVNIRGGPATGYPVITQVSYGDSLPVLDKSGGWYQVRLNTGASGWVAGWLVSVQSTPQEQPQPPAATTPAQPQPTPTQSGSSTAGGDNNGGTDSQSNKVLSLKASDSGGKTSTVVVANAPFSYSSFFLSNPDRLVVDLKGVAIGGLPQSTAVNSKSVSQVRAGYYQKNPDVTRLVFDLSGGVQYLASLSSDRKTLTVQTYVPDISSSFSGKVIAVDPGHGGSDPGALGNAGTREKDVTLDVAQRVAKLLQSRGAKVVMTRSGDQDVGLYERTDKANNAGANLFVSIHINSYTDSSVGGTTSYIYNGKVNTAQTAMIQESGRLARYIQDELVKALGLRDIGVRDANFAVLRTSNMPAVLEELAFISNPSEESYMNSDAFRNAAAEAIVKGIGRYFSEKRTA